MASRLTILGPPQLLDDHGRLIPIPAKAFALVAYILLTNNGAPASRAALRQFLWDTPDAKTAAANLRKFLLRIRERQEELGFELITEERDHVRLAKDARIDLAEFQKISASSDPSDLAQLCNLYRGELLEGLQWDETESGEWLRLQRTKLRDAFVGAVASRLEPVAENSDRMTMRVAARRLIEVDPYNEAGHRTLMRHFAEEGERARVREVFANLERRLRDDLDVAPDAETVCLFEKLCPAPASAEAAASPLPAQAMSQSPEGDSERRAPARPLESHFAAKEYRSGTPRLAVLPPSPFAAQDSSHHLAASLIEDVTIGLCRFKALSIVAPHTAAQISEDTKQSTFQTYQIDYAAETRLLSRGNESWLSVKLLDALGRNILWTEQYRFDVSAMAHHYKELSIAIVRALVERIERIEIARYDTEPDPSAYHHYLAGQRALRILDLPSARRARRAFRSALSAHSEFVPAIAGLARTHQLEWLLMARGDAEMLGEAQRLARLSIEIDPDDARGYRELGICSLFTGRFDESLQALAQGEACNPQYADLVSDFADALTHACQPAEALAKIRSAIELNPLCPDHYWWTAGGANFHLQRYREAIGAMSHMSDPSPAFRLLAASWAMLGEREQAAKYVRKTREIHPDFSVNGWLSILPIRDPKFAQHYEHSLRVAGFE